VLVIEHNLDVIKTADWLIDMGPEGGSRGGTVIAEGTPEQIAGNGDSYTGVYLKPILDGRAVPVGSIQPELLAPARCRSQRVARGSDGEDRLPAGRQPREATAEGRSQEDDFASAGSQGELNPRPLGSV
jgi:excinuclease ABC subunit A